MPKPPNDARPIRDAATVVLLRRGADGLETFMVCRHKKSGFMGGVHVFPGGKLDDEDRAAPLLERLVGEDLTSIAHRMNEPDAERAAGLMIAAVRETFEEAGLVLGTCRKGCDLARERQQLHEGAPFSGFASTASLSVDPHTLIPYARWVTPEVESYRFDTRFFVAIAPDGQEATHDGTETTSAAWLRPGQALKQMRDNTIELAPPTLRTLEWLADFQHPEDALQDAASRPPPLIRPKVIVQEDGWFLALPGDPAHPEPKQVIAGPTRLIFVDQQWRAVDL